MHIPILPGSSCVVHTEVCTEKTFQGCHQGLKRESKAVLILPWNLVPLASDPGVSHGPLSYLKIWNHLTVLKNLVQLSYEVGTQKMRAGYQ